MKTALFAPIITVLITQALWAEQVARPMPPPGTKSNSETSEAEVLKVNAMEDRGAKFRAYAVKYKGNEVILNDTLATTDKKVGDLIRFMVVRLEMPLPDGAGKIHTMQFSIRDHNLPKKK